MLYFFQQVEVEPTSKSALGQSMPEVSGAFVNCVVSASSEREAASKLEDALNEDGYALLHVESLEALDGTATPRLAELDRLLECMQGGDEVVYGEFHCYE